jgi:hypothetical protein
VKSRLVLAAAAATATLLAACGGPASTAGGPPAPPSFFGVNGDVLYQYALHGQADTLAAQLDAISGGGLAFVRSPANWSQIEPSPAAGRTGFDFTISDAFVSALASHQVSWQPIGQGLPIPQWAAAPKVYSVCGFRSAPARPQFLAIYLAAIAKRYGRGGSFWSAHPELPYKPVTTYEVGNEPNHYAFWCPRPVPPAYALTFIASAEAIHAIDPKATVELGGLAAFPDSADPLRLSPQAFLSAALAAQPRLKDEIDAVAFHPYATTPAVVVSNLIAFRKVLSADGLGRVPISVNEVGWSTVDGPGLPATSEEDRARYLAQVTAEIARRRRALDVLEIAPYAWTTAELNPADANQWYGIADPQTGAPYPSGTAYLDAVAASTG